MGDVVVDPHREPSLRSSSVQFVEHRLDHRRGELLGGQPVASSDDGRELLDASVGEALDQCRGHVQQERLTGGSGFLGAVEHRDRTHRTRQGRHEAFHRERPVEPHLDQTDPLPGGHEVVHGLMGALRTRTHHHHHTLGLGMPEVLEGGVPPAGEFSEALHRRLDDRGAGIVEHVRGLATLEERVGVL